MEMGMGMQLLAPGVEHSEAPKLRAKILGGLGDVLETLRHGAKEQAIEVAGVLQRQGPQVVRQGKDYMDVGRVEHLALPGGEPRGLGGPMACGATAVPTRVVCLDLVSTIVAWRDMAPEGGSPAQTDGPQRSVLLAREGRPIACQKSGAMLAHHISHFQWRPTHGSFSRSAGNARASKGRSVAGSAGGGHMEGEARTAQARVPQQQLDAAQVAPRCEQMRREAVPQYMWIHGLGDLGGVASLWANMGHAVTGDRLGNTVSRKEPRVELIELPVAS